MNNCTLTDNGHSDFGTAGNGGDGIEIEEFSSGNCIAYLTDCQANNTKAQAYDPSDNDDGYLLVVMTRCKTDLSGDDAFSPKEVGDGLFNAVVNDCEFKYPKDDGINGKEEDGGNMIMTITNTDVLMNEPNNSDDGDDGIQSYESGSGDLSFTFQGSSLVDGSDKYGIKLEEFNDGNADFEIRDSEIKGSDDWAVQLFASGVGSVGWANIDNSHLGNDGCRIYDALFNPISSWIRLAVEDSTNVGLLKLDGTSRPDPNNPGEVLIDNYLTVNNSDHSYSVTPSASWWVMVDDVVVHDGGPVP